MLFKRPNLRRLSAAFSLAFLTACVGTTPTTTPIDPQPGAGASLGQATGKTLFAIYLLGSDLEWRPGYPDGVPGAGTINLMQLVEQAKTLTAEQRKNFDVLVAFGGSGRPGWEGMKVADLDLLIEDAKDDRFGNHATYLHRDTAANMGRPETLQAFLGQVKARAAEGGSKRTFVDLWDHGGAWAGYGKPDDPAGMSVPEIAGAFAGSGLAVDLVGFDACLMANLEVASVLKPHARYLVASEELEPGHGWNYGPIVQALADKVNAPTTEIAKAVVDAFIDTPAYQETDGKTLSVIDLSKLGAVESALGSLSGNLSGNLPTAYRAILKSTTKARYYGPGSISGRLTLDLVDYGEQLQKYYPAAAGAIGSLKSAVQQAVVYNRNDGTRPNSHGLSITSVGRQANFAPTLYNESTVPLPAWVSLTRSFFAMGDADSAPPSLTDVMPRTVDGREGLQVRVTDDIGVQTVANVYAAETGSGLTAGLPANKLVGVVIRPATVLDDTNDVYFLPKWNGEAFVLKGSSGGDVLAPLSFQERHPDQPNLEAYTVDVIWQNQRAEMRVIWDTATKQGHVVAIRPYVSINGQQVPSRETIEPKMGDRFAFYYDLIDPDSDAQTEEIGPYVTVSGDLSWTTAPVNASGFSFGVVEDLKGNLEVGAAQAYNR